MNDDHFLSELRWQLHISGTRTIGRDCLDVPRGLPWRLSEALPDHKNEISWWQNLRENVGRALHLHNVDAEAKRWQLEEQNDTLEELVQMRSGGLVVDRARCVPQLVDMDRDLERRLGRRDSPRALVRALRRQIRIFAQWLGIPPLPRASWRATERLDDGSFYTPARGPDRKPRKRRAPAAPKHEQRLNRVLFALRANPRGLSRTALRRATRMGRAELAKALKLGFERALITERGSLTDSRICLCLNPSEIKAIGI